MTARFVSTPRLVPTPAQVSRWDLASLQSDDHRHGDRFVLLGHLVSEQVGLIENRSFHLLPEVRARLAGDLRDTAMSVAGAEGS